MNAVSLSRLQGALVGAALGDALGAWTQGLSPSAIRGQFGGPLTGFPDRRNPLLTDGSTYHFTNDGHLLTCVAESLLAAGGLDLADVAERIVRWSRTPDAGRTPSRTIIRAARNLSAGVPHDQSGLPSDSGTGLARTVPLGLCWGGDDGSCARAAARLVAVTHRNEQAEAGGATVALAVRWLASGGEPEGLLGALRGPVGDLSLPMADRLANVAACVQLDEEAAYNCLGRTAAAEDVVPSALLSFLAHPASPKAAMLMAANAGGRSDAIGSMTGALAGAACGYEALPADWVARLDRADELGDLARRLLGLVGRLTAPR